ncbi:methyltransferase-like protein 25 [Sergentomyia squamirostris]
MLSREIVQEALRKRIAFLDKVQPIVECHVVDFLWENHWQKLLPEALRWELEENSVKIVENLQEVFSGNYSKFEQLGQFITNAGCHSLQGVPEIEGLDGIFPKDLQNLKVSDFMTPKKEHEVKKTSQLISWLCKKSSSTTVVIDAGDGKGYLSSCLAFEYNLPVLGLETNANYQKSSKNRIEKLKKKWKLPDREDNYKSLAVTVTSDLNLREITLKSFPKYPEANFCLSGLHTCGDLAVTCLEIFTRDPDVKFLCNIGCCYNLLTKFPMSSFLSAQGVTMTDRARMLACQSLNTILREKSLPSNSLHFRTLFEQLVKAKHPDSSFQQLGKIKSSTFSDYFQRACIKMNLPIFHSQEELDEIFKNYNRTFLDLFYVLRASLAGAIEAVILLDRVHYLLESGVQSKVHLIKLFDYEISPRCYAIVAEKF